MELLLKHTQGKKPFFGVIFENSEDPEINKDLLELDTKFFLMVCGTGHETLHFKLMVDSPIIIREYEVKANMDEYKKWRIYIHLGVNFGHVIMVHDQPVIVKVNRKLFVLPIENFMNNI